MIQKISIKELKEILARVQIKNTITLDYDLCGIEFTLNGFKDTHYQSALSCSEFICKVLDLDPEPYNKKYIEEALIKRKLRQKTIKEKKSRIKVTWQMVGDYNRKLRDDLIEKDIRTRGYISDHGRSRSEVICPFCNSELWVYRWSYFATGKRCDCGALLGKRSAYQIKSNISNKTKEVNHG